MTSHGSALPDREGMALQGKSKAEDGGDQKMSGGGDSTSEKFPLALPKTPTTQPPCQVMQSDSGVFLSPLSQSSVLSPQQTERIQDMFEDAGDAYSQLRNVARGADNADLNSLPQDDQHDLGGTIPEKNCPSLSTASQPPAGGHHVMGGTIPGKINQSVSSGHSHKLSRRASKDSSSPSDDFTFQTKYLVLQFLHQSTIENPILTSMSTTSESEPRCKSYTERLGKQWQRNRPLSSPASPKLCSRSKPTKLKGSKSSPDLKDANFFKDMSSHKKLKLKRPQPQKSAAVPKRLPFQKKISPVQMVQATTLIRSVSENTETSETGTYISDADDELDTSFDSSQQGSTTSATFRSRLVPHHQAFRASLPTVQGEIESVIEVPFNVVEENVELSFPVSMAELNDVEHQPVLTVDQFVHVTSYVEQVRQTGLACSFQSPLHIPSAKFSPPQSSQNKEDGEEDKKGMENEEEDEEEGEEAVMKMVDRVIGYSELSDGQTQDMAGSEGFEPHNTTSCTVEETEGAWGGIDMDDADGECAAFGGRADRSRLRLELCEQDYALVEVMESLRHDIEEEILSLESEFEEGNVTLSMHALTHSQSAGPETMEIARRLARIGDEVQHKYFDHLDKAVGQLVLDNYRCVFTYENFREAALMALDSADVNGWQQVVALLLYSQHVALLMAQRGRCALHRLVDYTVRLLADTAATFIIRQGGWASISAIDRSSSTPSSPETSRVHPPAFRHHQHHHLPDTTTTPHSPFPHLSHCGRSASAPNLQPAGEWQACRTVAKGSSQEPASVSACAVEEHIAASTPTSAVQVTPALSSAPGQKNDTTDGREDGEEGESDGESAETKEGECGGTNGSGTVEGGTTSLVSHATVLTGCAVSVALIGMGVAFALNLMRG